MPGRLVICATPIGNLGDASPRLAEALATAAIVYAEDTRRTATLLRALGVSVAVRSYFVGNESERARELAERLRHGDTVALVTDAGMPGVADPGLSAVRAAREAGADVFVVPGPSAVTASVAVSGFPADRFCFEGFLPRKGADRARRLDEIGAEPRTVVVFASPHRLMDDLGDLARSCGGEREICITRELTKRYEETWWGTLAGAVREWSGREVRGELTLVLGPRPEAPPDLSEAVGLARQLVAGGASRSEAARRSAAETGVARRRIYDALVQSPS